MYTLQEIINDRHVLTFLVEGFTDAVVVDALIDDAIVVEFQQSPFRNTCLVV